MTINDKVVTLKKSKTSGAKGPLQSPSNWQTLATRIAQEAPPRNPTMFPYSPCLFAQAFTNLNSQRNLLMSGTSLSNSTVDRYPFKLKFDLFFIESIYRRYHFYVCTFACILDPSFPLESEKETNLPAGWSSKWSVEQQ